MMRSKTRSAPLLVAALAAASVIGGVGAVGGFVVGRLWPIRGMERLWPSVQVSGPSGWREFAKTDLPRYESARVVIDGILYLMGGFWTSDPKATTRVEALDLSTAMWRRMKNMPVALTHANAATVRGAVWLAGGFEGDHPGQVTARVWRWEVRTDTWSAGPPLPAPRGGGALVAIGGALHYFGGYLPDRNTDSADHWRLVPGETTWQRRASLPNPRGQLIGIALDGWIYAISGSIGHDPIPNDVTFAERYDPITDRWESIASPPFAVSHNEHSTFIYEGRIITVGGRALSEGRDNQDDVLSYNPITDAWTHLGRIPERLLGAVAFATDDAVVAGLGAVNGSNPENKLLWKADLRNVWRQGDPLPDALGETAGGVVNGLLYLVGEGSRLTLRYDLATGTWDRLAAVRPALGHHHAAEVLNGELWLFGGLGRANTAGRVQIYNPVSRRWRFGPPMPFRGGASASALIDGRFFLAGGIANNLTTGEAAMLDPSTMVWTAIAPMLRPRNHAASGTDGERLYVFGGRGPGSGDRNVVANGFDDVQIYDPRTNRWRVSDGTPGAPMPLPQARGGAGKAVWIGGEFWIIGGETKDGAGATSRGVYARVDIYNPLINRWRAGPPLQTARHGVFPLLYDGQIAVAGGGVISGGSDSRVVELIWPKVPIP